MAERASLAALNSVTQGLVGVVSGSLLDGFFTADDQEDALTAILMMCAQNLAGGVLMGALTQMALAGGQDADPTGGAYTVVPFFLCQTQYRRRLRRISSLIRDKITAVVGPMPSAA